MDRTQELSELATAAELREADLLRIAKAELPPKEAVRDLMRRFPGAFGPPQPVPAKQYSDMTIREREVFCRRNHQPPPRPDRNAPR